MISKKKKKIKKDTKYISINDYDKQDLKFKLLYPSFT